MPSTTGIRGYICFSLCVCGGGLQSGPIEAKDSEGKVKPPLSSGPGGFCTHKRKGRWVVPKGSMHDATKQTRLFSTFVTLRVRAERPCTIYLFLVTTILYVARERTGEPAGDASCPAADPQRLVLAPRKPTNDSARAVAYYLTSRARPHEDPRAA